MLNVISTLPAQLLLTMAENAGVDLGPVVAGLGFDAHTLREHERIDWDTYCLMIERLEVAAGGPDRFDATMARGYHLSLLPELQWIREVFTSPIALVRGIVEVIDPALFPTVDFALETLAPNRLMTSARLRPGARSCRSFFRATVAALPGLTSHGGMPPLMVEVRELTDRSLVTLLEVPPWHPSRAPDPDLARLSQDLVRAFADELRALDDAVEQHASRIARVGALGRELARHLELEPLAEALVTMLARLGFERCVLHLLEPGGRATRSWQNTHAPGAMTRAFPLLADGQEIGRLELGGPGDEPTVETLLPWIGVALGRARAAASTDPKAPRVATLSRRLHLTTRQAEVLAGLVQGAANKEIAHVLGCAESTVEYHVTQLLKRTGAANRTELMARFWAGTLGAAPEP